MLDFLRTVAAASSSSSSWNSELRRWLAIRPSGRNRIIRIEREPEEQQPLVLEEPQLLRDHSRTTAPSSGPATVPMPPRTTAASRNADSRKTYGVRCDRARLWALIGAGQAGQERAHGEGEQLELEVLTPIAEAAVSSSRMATQARPMRLLLARMKTKMTNADQQQQPGSSSWRSRPAVIPKIVLVLAEVDAERGPGPGSPEMPLGPLVRFGPEMPSRLLTVIRKISPKPSVTMAR